MKHSLSLVVTITAIAPQRIEHLLVVAVTAIAAHLINLSLVVTVTAMVLP